uniref:Uncharacterized protein n=1 Tax=viral metagenome TaxID=1070528 RepID=A0A6C0ERF9_9ZZZZ
MLFITILFLLFNYSISIERIWLIRHCDKPRVESNPCCSTYGYNRSINWFFYFKQYLNKDNNIEIYSSNYNEKIFCSLDVIPGYKPNNSCQKSQRMFLTAYYIQEKLITNNYKIYHKINLNFCVGDKNNLIKYINKNVNVNDAIVVWEHNELIEIIREYNIDISKWRKRNNDEYTIVFLIDVKTRQLYYDCYDFIKNTTSCSNKINKWLTKFKKINFYYNDNSLTTINNINFKNNYLPGLYFLLFISIICCILYLICFIIELYNTYKKRVKYTIII